MGGYSAGQFVEDARACVADIHKEEGSQFLSVVPDYICVFLKEATTGFPPLVIKFDTTCLRSQNVMGATSFG